MTHRRRRRLSTAVLRHRHNYQNSLYQCKNAGASQGLAMNADGKRSSAMGSSRAHIAPSTATVSVTYKRFAFGKSGLESADPA